MKHDCRYIVWRKDNEEPAGDSVRVLLDQFPTVKIVKCEGPDYAVVFMDVSTEKEIRHIFPDLCIEEDVQYRMTSLH